ncbi:MAG: hypothetical protein IPJ88_16780 [Myxococcales bacterium]|nr:MAG: hypothetical protein IPJ88_16780 [Myxococcales bacterium]
MTEEPVSLDDLLQTRERLIGHVQKALTDQDRVFLLSFKNRTPDWSLLELKGVNELPAVKWKLVNLKRMKAEQHTEAMSRLKTILEKGSGCFT